MSVQWGQITGRQQWLPSLPFAKKDAVVGIDQKLLKEEARYDGKLQN